MNNIEIFKVSLEDEKLSYKSTVYMQSKNFLTYKYSVQSIESSVVLYLSYAQKFAAYSRFTNECN